MRLRFRFPAALLALVALLSFTTGGAWAASCASEMEAEPASENAGESGAPCLAVAGMSQDDGSRQGDGDDSGTPDCPYMPVGVSAACGAAAALAAGSPSDFDLSVRDARLSFPSDDARVLLLAANFFRPPIV